MRLGRYAVAFCAAMLITPFGATGASPADNSSPVPSREAARAARGLRFEENVGQTDPRVRFIVRAGGWTVFLSGDEAVYSHAGSAVRMRLNGADPGTVAEAGTELPGVSNYFVGNDPALWRTNVKSYDNVRFESVLPGVDLRYYESRGSLEYDVVVAPGADPRAVSWTVDGADSVAIDPCGDLLIAAKAGNLRQRVPVIYQEHEAGRTSVSGGFVLTGYETVSFEIGEYDRTLPLVIDPQVAFCTYLGGANGNEVLPGLAITPDGGIVIGNYTDSAVYPVQGGIGGPKGERDIVITRLTSSGTEMVYSTYLGGSAADIFFALALDAAGGVVLTGNTFSQDFPTVNAYQPASGGNQDGFVARLNAAGSAIVYSTYLGGSGIEDPRAIAIDEAGNVVVTGGTASSDFPTRHAIQTQLLGTQDGFIARFGNSGSLIASTYYGGSLIDIAVGVAVGIDGSVYVCGLTSSTDFPVVNAAYDTNSGSLEAFVAKFDEDLSTATYSTYLGGSEFETTRGIAVDTQGRAVVGGLTFSTDFPLMRPVQQVYGGDGDAYVTVFAPSGSAIEFSSYIGGSAREGCGKVAIVPGKVYMAGYVQSTDFPIVDPLPGWSTVPVSIEGFLTKIDLAGPSVTFSTLLGGSGMEDEITMEIDHRGIVAFAGATDSTDIPMLNSIQPAIAPVGFDAFVVKILDPMPPDVITAGSLTAAGKPYRVKLTGINFQPGLTVTIGSDSTPWPAVKRKNDGTILIKGAQLKKRFPKGVPVAIRVENPEGGSDVVAFTR